MENDEIKKLFCGFDPELSPDIQFMSKLQRNLAAVEVVKQHSASVRKRNRIAVVVAALSGFAMGVLFTLLMPVFGDWFMTINLSVPYISSDTVTVDFELVAWILVALVSGITAYNVYEITITRLAQKKVPA